MLPMQRTESVSSCIQVTRHLDRPAPVEYRTGGGWEHARVLAMRRSEGTFTVLIALSVPGGADRYRWVDRDRIRVDNPPSHR